jgi:hypothetical protein
MPPIDLAPAGPIPFAQTSLNPAPQMGMSIAQMMLQQSQENLRANQAKWAGLGQGIAGAGEAVTQGLRENRLAQAQQIENQKNQMAVQGMKFQMEGHQALAQALQSGKKPDGSFDMDAITGQLASLGHPEQIDNVKSLMGFQKDAMDIQTAHAANLQKFGDFAANGAHEVLNRLNDPDGGVSAYTTASRGTQALGQMLGVKIPPEIQQLDQLAQKTQAELASGDPARMAAARQAWTQAAQSQIKGVASNASPELQQKWAEQEKTKAEAEKAETTVLEPGAVAVRNGKVIAGGGEKPITPYERAELGNQAARLNLERWTASGGAFSGQPMPGGGGAPGAAPVAPQPGTSPGAPPAALPGGALPQPGANLGPGGATGDEFLKTLPTGLQSTVKALAEGRLQPSPRQMSTPAGQALLSATMKYDPSFDAVNYGGRAKARTNFEAGDASKQIVALNTVVGHLGDLSGKMDALGNSGTPAYNAVKNWIKTQTGSPDVTNFDTVKKGVTDELTRVWRQAGGSEQDIKSWASGLSAAGSPEQLKGQLATIGGMLESRLSALDAQKNQALGVGGKDIQVITPESRKTLDVLQGRNAPSGAPAAGTVKGGYRFKGGDPSQKANWEPV